MPADNGITVAEADSYREPGKEDDHKRLQQIANPTTGIITGVRRVPVPPGEPNIESYVVVREDFTPFTDGEAMAHDEGGCAFTSDAALTATYGEAIERYCGCVYRSDTLRTAAFETLAEPALDPTAVVNFSATQRAEMPSDSELCDTDDTIAWVSGVDLRSGTPTLIPAQLVYLSYPPATEPFIRNPISTGLAAGSEPGMATHNGLMECIERDAFMIYYLTATELPVIDIGTTPPRIQRLADRITARGCELIVMDATTDLGVPVAIAVLVDRTSRPAVTVAAAAGVNPTAVIEDAIAEVVQTRLSAIHRLESANSPADIVDSEIDSFGDRALLWADHDRISALDYWIESERTTTFDAFAPEESVKTDPVKSVTAAGYDIYAVDVTTRDIDPLGVTVKRVIVPRLQPLYLHEQLRYFGGDRLSSVPVEMGYREQPIDEDAINTVPHPFP